MFSFVLVIVIKERIHTVLKIRSYVQQEQYSGYTGIRMYISDMYSISSIFTVRYVHVYRYSDE